MMHSDPDSLVAMAQLVHTLARQIHPLRIANPGLARGIRQAGTAIARSVAAAHLAPGPVMGGHAMRHRLRACEQALDLVELLQQAIDAGYFTADIRQEAQRVACRLVILSSAAQSRPLSRPRAGRGALQPRPGPAVTRPARCHHTRALAVAGHEKARKNGEVGYGQPGAEG
jgi:hypothetical protein